MLIKKYFTFKWIPVLATTKDGLFYSASVFHPKGVIGHSYECLALLPYYIIKTPQSLGTHFCRISFSLHFLHATWACIHYLRLGKKVPRERNRRKWALSVTMTIRKKAGNVLLGFCSPFSVKRKSRASQGSTWGWMMNVLQDTWAFHSSLILWRDWLCLYLKASFGQSGCLLIKKPIILSLAMMLR